MDDVEKVSRNSNTAPEDNLGRLKREISVFREKLKGLYISLTYENPVSNLLPKDGESLEDNDEEIKTHVEGSQRRSRILKDSYEVSDGFSFNVNKKNLDLNDGDLQEQNCENKSSNFKKPRISNVDSETGKSFIATDCSNLKNAKRFRHCTISSEIVNGNSRNSDACESTFTAKCFNKGYNNKSESPGLDSKILSMYLETLQRNLAPPISFLGKLSNVSNYPKNWDGDFVGSNSETSTDISRFLQHTTNMSNCGFTAKEVRDNPAITFEYSKAQEPVLDHPLPGSSPSSLDNLNPPDSNLDSCNSVLTFSNSESEIGHRHSKFPCKDQELNPGDIMHDALQLVKDDGNLCSTEDVKGSYKEKNTVESFSPMQPNLVHQRDISDISHEAITTRISGDSNNTEDGYDHLQEICSKDPLRENEYLIPSDKSNTLKSPSTFDCDSKLYNADLKISNNRDIPSSNNTSHDHPDIVYNPFEHSKGQETSVDHSVLKNNLNVPNTHSFLSSPDNSESSVSLPNTPESEPEIGLLDSNFSGKEPSKHCKLADQPINLIESTAESFLGKDLSSIYKDCLPDSSNETMLTRESNDFNYTEVPVGLEAKVIRVLENIRECYVDYAWEQLENLLNLYDHITAHQKFITNIKMYVASFGETQYFRDYFDTSVLQILRGDELRPNQATAVSKNQHPVSDNVDCVKKRGPSRDPVGDLVRRFEKERSCLGSNAGNAATTNRNQGSIFGNAAAKNIDLGPLFSNAAKKNSDRGSIFGNPATTTSERGSNFGNAATTNNDRGISIGNVETMSRNQGIRIGSVETKNSVKTSNSNDQASDSDSEDLVDIFKTVVKCHPIQKFEIPPYASASAERNLGATGVKPEDSCSKHAWSDMQKYGIQHRNILEGCSSDIDSNSIMVFDVTDCFSQNSSIICDNLIKEYLMFSAKVGLLLRKPGKKLSDEEYELRLCSVRALNDEVECFNAKIIITLNDWRKQYNELRQKMVTSRNTSRDLHHMGILRNCVKLVGILRRFTLRKMLKLEKYESALKFKQWRG